MAYLLNGALCKIAIHRFSANTTADGAAPTVIYRHGARQKQWIVLATGIAANAAPTELDTCNYLGTTPCRRGDDMALG
jgi:hypothetical protein